MKIRIKPYAKYADLYITRLVPGDITYVIGDSVTILSVLNIATSTNPVYRYRVQGAWVDHDALSRTDPLGDAR